MPTSARMTLVLVNAFVWYRGRGGPAAALRHISYPVNAAQNVPLALQILTGDGTLVGDRCSIRSSHTLNDIFLSWLAAHMLWARDWRVLVSLSILRAGTIGLWVYANVFTFRSPMNKLAGVTSLVPATLVVSCAYNVPASGANAPQIPSSIWADEPSPNLVEVSSMIYLVVTALRSSTGRIFAAFGISFDLITNDSHVYGMHYRCMNHSACGSEKLEDALDFEGCPFRFKVP
ncbi:hypothetical protein K488DRAFT_73849 [Vararia minispora EC-137]|uniref:Uncharacterized protein n=1 Tax=Vararia minispora EC-137 TaxID=1314806 RepID=A0ACB8Q9D8_9AGAM|nr:hypothetical protein K488DRAFT_73849 [Vararia minispora EC-137]